MLRSVNYRQLVSILLFPLCTIILVSGFLYSAPAAHAASPGYIQGPDIACLNVFASNVSNQRTVSVTNPPGGGVRYDLTLYVSVTAPCTKNDLVNNIVITGARTGECANGATGTNNTTFNGTYGLYPGGGYGDTYVGLTDRCIIYTNSEPTSSVVPLSLYVTITATGSLINGNVKQNVTSGSLTLSIW